MNSSTFTFNFDDESIDLNLTPQNSSNEPLSLNVDIETLGAQSVFSGESLPTNSDDDQDPFDIQKISHTFASESSSLSGLDEHLAFDDSLVYRTPPLNAIKNRSFQDIPDQINQSPAAEPSSNSKRKEIPQTSDRPAKRHKSVAPRRIDIGMSSYQISAQALSFMSQSAPDQKDQPILAAAAPQGQDKKIDVIEIDCENEDVTVIESKKSVATEQKKMLSTSRLEISKDDHYQLVSYKLTINEILNHVEAYAQCFLTDGKKTSRPERLLNEAKKRYASWYVLLEPTHRAFKYANSCLNNIDIAFRTISLKNRQEIAATIDVYVKRMILILQSIVAALSQPQENFMVPIIDSLPHCIAKYHSRPRLCDIQEVTKNEVEIAKRSSVYAARSTSASSRLFLSNSTSRADSSPLSSSHSHQRKL